jgi:uncharacterized repeat protein (TIGR03803 family)
MTKRNLYERACLVLLVFSAMASVSSAQTFTTLHSFDGSDGATPTFPSLTQGLDGNLYGTTVGGGTQGQGTIFDISPQGTFTTLYGFCILRRCDDGKTPRAGVILGTDGTFWGTTEFGGGPVVGGYGQGELFRFIPEGGVLQTSYVFGQAVGDKPFSAPVQAANGDIYVTTPVGGRPDTGSLSSDTGAILKLSGNGGSYDFCANKHCPDGRNPYGGLVQGSDGNLYGTTSRGGASNAGTIFRIPTKVKPFARLHSFDTSDGAYPYAALIQGADGNFYGTTELGGANGGGTIFQITPAGTLMSLYSFCAVTGCIDGKTPVAGLTQATDGNFYGTTELGGANGAGTIFQITSGGTLTTLYSFCAQPSCADGGSPRSGLVQGTDGNFYGAASVGGADNDGTIFSLDVELSPFVKTVPAAGKVGLSIYVLGTNLTGATSVSFNGTSATFTVVSATEITTSVPTGAISGFVTVTTPGGTLSSNVAFQIEP